MNNENYSCQFVLKEGEKIVLEIAENNNAIQKIYDGKTFVVYPPKEYEVDGLYQDFNYDELGFDADEVKILFKNIKLFVFLQSKFKGCSFGAEMIP